MKIDDKQLIIFTIIGGIIVSVKWIIRGNHTVHVMQNRKIN